MTGSADNGVYEVGRGDGHDVVRDASLSTETVLKSASALNTATFTATWASLGQQMVGRRFRLTYRLVVVKTATNEEVYRSRDHVDF